MSLPENCVTVNHSNSSPIDEIKKPSPLRSSSKVSDPKVERSVEDFLNKIVPNNNKASDVDNNSNSGSVTLKENSQHSSLLFENESEIPIDLEEDSKHQSDIENNYQVNEISNHSIPEHNSKAAIVDLISEHSIKSPKDSNVNSSEKIATPTIKFTKKTEHYWNELEENAQKPPDYQEFVNKLTQMSSLIQEKDEEIKKLSQKLIEIESKSKSCKKSSSSSSSSSCSSDESKKSSKQKVKSKKKKKDKNKPQDKNEKKKLEVKKEKKKSKSKENKEKIEDEVPFPNTVETSNNNTIDQENQPKLDNNDKQNTSVSYLDESTNFRSITSDDLLVDKDKLAPDLKKKLDELESEVRRLQQANIDSILTLQKLQDNNASSSHLSNDVVINQLLVDHNLLKEELQQLKWEHSKLTQPTLLAEEINQLKKDMNFLRKQNDFLKHFTKKSSRSLNHLASTSYHGREFKDNFDSTLKDRQFYVSNIPDSNNISNYIYQKLQNHRKPTSETPSMHNMIKHNIESLESPYHVTCQNIQYSTPFSGGPTYRARKVSDSSSVLVEDIKPKMWVETVPKNYKSTYQSFSNDLLFPPNNYHQKDFDEQSEESYITVTTAVTDKSEDEWRSNIRKYNENHGDFLSTQDSEISDVSTIKDTQNYQSGVRHDYSFTPKKPSDLNLEDVVKFVRPGGKMSTGRVCFIGHLPGRNEVCVGLELGEDAGKHDGLFEGNRYFQCRKNRGVFISFHKIILAYKSI